MSYLEGAPSRFVLVGTQYEDQSVTVVDADAAGTAGDITLLNKDGSGFDSSSGNSDGEGIALRLVTDNQEVGASLSSDILTPVFSAADVVKYPTDKTAFAQPKAHIQELDLGGMTFTAGEVVMMNVRYRNVGAVSDGRFFDVWADHTVSTTTAAAVGAGLVTQWNKTNDKRKVDSATAYMGATGFVGNWAAADKITFVTGSKTATVYETNGTTLETATATLTVVAIIDGVPYNVAMTAGSSTITLDRPYEGSDAAQVDISSNVTDAEADTIYLIGDIQSKIDFNHPFRPIDFDTTMTVDGEEATSLVTVDTQQADIGNGYGPHVAVIEELSLAQFSGLMWTEYRRMRTRRLETVSTKQYDQFSFTLRKNTAQYPGSVVNSEAEITVFIPRDAGSGNTAADLLTDIQAND
jgi:hypothetical protein